MCGICGIFDRGGAPINEQALVAMRDVMLTRGPDDAGLHIGPHIGLGHRRLSIIDLSPAGKNPMPNEDGSVQLVLNGEIYNFAELRPELEAAGHRFRSRSDTEVLVHGYEQWGLESLVKRIRGMFAFALWDSNRRELSLVRDRVGKKPLYYYDDGRLVLFSSDIKSIWLARDGGLTIDPKAVDEFLFYYFIQQDRSIFREVRKVQPADLMTFRMDAARTSTARYWNISFAAKSNRTESEWLDGLDEQLHRAVRRRLVSDVPLGAFLSGGVDSSLVAAIMAKESTRPVSTYTVGFEKIQQYDERVHARRVADHIGSQHTELVLDPDVWAILPMIVWHYGEPFGDASAVPTYFVSKAAREHVTVVLTGDGGDEALAGYDPHLSAHRARRFRWIPRILLNALLVSTRQAARMLPDNVTLDRGALFAEHLAGRLDLAVRRTSVWRDRRRERLWRPDKFAEIAEWHPTDPVVEKILASDGPTPLDVRMQAMLWTTLPSDYLAKVDVASMAVSLEARCPFLDSDFLEYTATIPADVLLAGAELKHLGKLLASRYVPRESIYRPKWGFGLPFNYWLRDEWYSRVKRLLTEGPAARRDLFDLGYVRTIMEEHRAGRHDHSYRIWTLMVLEIWHQLFIDRNLKPTDTPAV